MDKLEHNIQKAFADNDANTHFQGKEDMWNRLDASLAMPKKVAAWWRVAAVFLGLLLAGGVFAGLKFRAQQNAQIDKLQIQNAQLQMTIDSLSALPAVVKTETQTVEKIVYRDRIVHAAGIEPDNNWKQKYFELQDSEVLLAGQKKNYESELAKLNTELIATRNELSAMQKTPNPSEGEPFLLKSERVELGVQKKPAVDNPEMEVKIFPKNFIEKTNDLNRTLFKK